MVVLNRQTSSWRPVLASVPRDFILGVLVYINDLPNKLKPIVKLFADDTSFLLPLRIRMKVLMFSAMTFSQSLHGLIIGKCFLFQILVNQLKTCYFQGKKIQVHPTMSLKNVRVEWVPYQKYLAILLDDKLNFKRHIDSAILKVFW